jgi:hypothetical protein
LGLVMLIPLVSRGGVQLAQSHREQVPVLIQVIGSEL